jgi:hypothetical protein
VTVQFSDGTTIQILPALKTSQGTRIPRSDGTAWSKIVRPEVFARELTDVNKATGGKVIPIIKLFKTLNDRLPEDARLSGYHIEALAVEAFKDYTGSTNPKEMLMHFTQSASGKILTPVKDMTGQSRNANRGFEGLAR